MGLIYGEHVCQPPNKAFRPIGQRWNCPECGDEWSLAGTDTIFGKEWRNRTNSLNRLKEILQPGVTDNPNIVRGLE